MEKENRTRRVIANLGEWVTTTCETAAGRPIRIEARQNGASANETGEFGVLCPLSTGGDASIRVFFERGRTVCLSVRTPTAAMTLAVDLGQPRQDEMAEVQLVFHNLPLRFRINARERRVEGLYGRRLLQIQEAMAEAHAADQLIEASQALRATAHAGFGCLPNALAALSLTREPDFSEAQREKRDALVALFNGPGFVAELGRIPALLEGALLERGDGGMPAHVITPKGLPPKPEDPSDDQAALIKEFVTDKKQELDRVEFGKSVLMKGEIRVKSWTTTTDWKAVGGARKTDLGDGKYKVCQDYERVGNATYEKYDEWILTIRIKCPDSWTYENKCYADVLQTWDEINVTERVARCQDYKTSDTPDGKAPGPPGDDEEPNVWKLSPYPNPAHAVK